MAFGFQINDALGNKVLDDSMLAAFIIAIGDMPTASGSRVHAGAQSVSNVQAIIYANGQTNAIDVTTSIAYNATNQTVTWTGVRPTGQYALIGYGDSNPTYGISIGAGSGTTISHRYNQMVFIGKAVNVTASGVFPTVGKYSINAPAGVTKVIPFVYSTTGIMLTNTLRVGSTFTFDTIWESDNAAQIYCFAQSSEVPVSAPFGMKVLNSAGVSVFDSGNGRNILRNMDSFSFSKPTVNVYSQRQTPFTVTSPHAAKAKPAYALVLDSVCFDAGDIFNGGVSNTTAILMRTVSPTSAAFSTSPATWSSPYTYVWSDVYLGGLVIDGADYD